ncbi:putative polygalacturonase 2 precursor [Bombardia bombarda]|uniref:endo-polygalacturonase n=1 Tax=Bombardia bombarda TaxID=252184 RepID=A0AA39TKD8_9PEZI|nr:putative polygalacturonase 2 precursor [Bombardia bombarda]
MMKHLSLVVLVYFFLPLFVRAPYWPLLNETKPCFFNGSAGFLALGAMSSSCTDIVLSHLSVPPGATLDLRKLKRGSSGYREWAGPLLSISGTNISIKGAPGSVLNGSGELWWDGLGQNGKIKPRFFQAHGLIDSTIDGIHILSSLVHVFSINGCRNLAVSNVTVDSSAGDSLSGKNTDAFDISQSSNVTIIGARVYNQDDCVAINSGTNITFRKGICVGGHGLSVGSIGGRTDNIVNRVLFENSVIANSENGLYISYIHLLGQAVIRLMMHDLGVRIKTKHGTSGTVNGITGTVSFKDTDVFVNCGDRSCASWSWTGVSVSGGKKSSKCVHLPLGIAC